MENSGKRNGGKARIKTKERGIEKGSRDKVNNEGE